MCLDLLGFNRCSTRAVLLSILYICTYLYNIRYKNVRVRRKPYPISIISQEKRTMQPSQTLPLQMASIVGSIRHSPTVNNVVASVPAWLLVPVHYALKNKPQALFVVAVVIYVVLCASVRFRRVRRMQRKLL